MSKSVKKYLKRVKHSRYNKTKTHTGKTHISKTHRRKTHRRKTHRSKTHRSKTFRKNRTNKRYNKTLRGGKFCLEQLGAPWNPYAGGKYYKLSKSGIDVGGNNPYFGQQGGNIFNKLSPQPIVNQFRVAENNVDNLFNMYKGKELKPSPLPWKNQYN